MTFKTISDHIKIGTTKRETLLKKLRATKKYFELAKKTSSKKYHHFFNRALIFIIHDIIKIKRTSPLEFYNSLERISTIKRNRLLAAGFLVRN